MTTKFRKKIVAGNWKMNLSVSDATELASAVSRDLADFRDVEVILCPPFTALRSVGEVISGGNVKLGAQNLHWDKDGAFTGEISATMLRDLYCRYVILGHSERRTLFGETDEIVNRKAAMAIESGLEAIVCVGEQLQQREADETEAVVGAQVRGSLNGLEAKLDKVIIAYEPVWAIGTGLTATPEQAQEVHCFIRRTVEQMAGDDVAGGIRIQYGGSVKSANAREIMAQPDVDGALVGGAALEARSFSEIVRAGASGASD